MLQRRHSRETACESSRVFLAGRNDVFGFAADSPHPGEHGTVDKAMVSEETDKAYDEKPNMGTKFNLYLAPDIPETVPPIKKDVPKMGDTGIPQESLLQALLVAGGCYLVSDGVAVACKCGRRKPKKTAELKNA